MRKLALTVLGILLVTTVVWELRKSSAVDSSKLVQKEKEKKNLQKRQIAKRVSIDHDSKISLSEVEELKKFQNVEIIDQRITREPRDSDLSVIRETLIKTKMKYPYLKIKESFKVNESTGELEEIESVIYSANQMLVSGSSSLNSVKDTFFSDEVSTLSDDIYLVTFNSDVDLDTVDGNIEKSRQNPQFHFIEPNYVKSISTTPNEPSFSELWGMNNANNIDIDAPQAWSITTGSRDVVVGVIDTGVNYNHPDLKNNIYLNAGETGTDEAGNNKETNGIDDDGNGFIDDVRGWDFVNKDNDPDDDNGHGTHCSGTIGAVGDNGKGVVGVCWNVKIMPLKFISSSGGGYASDAVRCIDYATKMGVDLTSNSWGGGGYSNAVRSVISKAAGKNILFVAAAGNEENNNDNKPSYPASYGLENILSVAAIDRNGNLASFSNYGQASVDLGAPGVSIRSTWLNEGYKTISGTSMACPHVSGAVALLFSEKSGASYSEIKEALLSNTKALNSLSGKSASGLLSAGNALSQFVADDEAEAEAEVEAEAEAEKVYVAAEMLSPISRTKFSSKSVTFSWNSGENISGYKLVIGQSFGSGDIFNGEVSGLSKLIDNMPTNGEKIYVRLVSLTDHSELSHDYQYEAFRDVLPPTASKLISPVAGTLLENGLTTFEIDEGHRLVFNWIYIGSRRGSWNYFSGSFRGAKKTIRLNAQSKSVYVRIWSLTDKYRWIYNDYEYEAEVVNKAPSRSTIISPTEDDSLQQGEDVTFKWSTATGVRNEYLFVLAGNRYVFGGRVSSNEKTLNIPLGARRVRAYLYSRVNGRWKRDVKRYSVK